MSTTHWEAYKNHHAMAGIHRERVVYFAGKHNWDKAYRSAARSKKSQVKADEHFNFYLDALALNDAFNNAPDTVATFHDLVIQRRYRRRSDPHDIYS